MKPNQKPLPKDIQEYLNQLEMDGKSKNTLIAYGSNLKVANEWKPLVEWDKTDVNTYVLKIKKEKKASGFEYTKLVLKIFFKFHGKDITDHITAKIKSEEVLEAKDILTTDEINKMIDATHSLMYKALMAFCFESGARISEILEMKVGDIQETGRGMVLSVYETKKGKLIKRKGLYLFAAGYIRNYVNSTTKTKSERLFSITKNTAYKAFKRIEVAAGIEKRANPHAFRHAQATDMVKRGYQETIIRKKLGWTPTSPMIARYTHITDDDLFNATLEKSGLDVPKQIITNLNMAEPSKIADTSMVIKKLASDNDEMQERLKQIETDKEDMKKEFDAKLEKMWKIITHAYVPTDDGYVHPKLD